MHTSSIIKKRYIPFFCVREDKTAQEHLRSGNKEGFAYASESEE
jgi:hypothetical protein